MTKKKEQAEATAITPVKIGGEIISSEAMDEMFEGTTGQAASPLDALSLYNQGKEDYWAFGEDEKKGAVNGIFLHAAVNEYIFVQLILERTLVIRTMLQYISEALVAP